MTLRPVLIAGLLCLSGCIHESLTDFALAPHYQPQEDGLPASACAVVGKATVSDARQSPRELGYRYNEGSPNERHKVTVEGEFAPYEQEVLDSLLRRARYQTRPDGVRLKVTVKQLEVIEKHAFNSNYNARAVIELEVGRGGGRCEGGSAEGEASKYGSDGNADNYNEALNEALEKAIIAGLSLPNIQSALCGACGGEARQPNPL